MSSNSPMWRQYSARDGRITKEDFDAMPLVERIALHYLALVTAPTTTSHEEESRVQTILSALTSERVSSTVNTAIKAIASEAIVAAIDEVVPECAIKHHADDSEWQTGFTTAYMQVRYSLLSLASKLISS